MAASIAELDALLNDRQARLPQMVEDYPNDADFWVAFAANAEAIEDKADERAYAHVMQRINAMLVGHGRFIAGIDLEVEA